METKTIVTLRNFSGKYLQRQIDFAQMISVAAQTNADGYELPATQLVPSYPYVSDEFAALIVQCGNQYGIRPVCYAASMDIGKIKGRQLTEAEMLSCVITDIQSANALGCKILREPYFLPPEVLARLAFYGEVYGVQVGIEVPEMLTESNVYPYIQRVQEIESKYIGLIPEIRCSIFSAQNEARWASWNTNLAQLLPYTIALCVKCKGAEDCNPNGIANALASLGFNGTVLFDFEERDTGVLPCQRYISAIKTPG